MEYFYGEMLIKQPYQILIKFITEHYVTLQNYHIEQI